MVPITAASAGMSATSIVVPGRGREARLISAIRDTAQRLARLTETELQQASVTLRDRVAQQGPDPPDVQVEAFALMRDAIRRVHRVELYDVQLLAALILANGRVAEMQTGEGKTLSCAPAAYLHGLTGRGVHIATPNAYLAQRDFELLVPAFRLLGVSVGLLPEKVAADRKRAGLSLRRDVRHGLRIGLRLPARPVIPAANGWSCAGADVVGASPRQ